MIQKLTFFLSRYSLEKEDIFKLAKDGLVQSGVKEADSGKEEPLAKEEYGEGSPIWASCKAGRFIAI